jgi:hypothetical protein
VTPGEADAQAAFREVMSGLRANGFSRLKDYDGRARVRAYVALVVRDLLLERAINLLVLDAGREWQAFEAFFGEDMRRMIDRVLPGAGNRQNREDAYQAVWEALLKNDLQRLRAYSGRGSPSGFVLHTIGASGAGACADTGTITTAAGPRGSVRAAQLRGSRSGSAIHRIQNRQARAEPAAENRGGIGARPGLCGQWQRDRCRPKSAGRPGPGPCRQAGREDRPGRSRAARGGRIRPGVRSPCGYRPPRITRPASRPGATALGVRVAGPLTPSPRLRGRRWDEGAFPRV